MPGIMRPLPPRPGTYKPKYKGCEVCWTVVFMENGVKMCMHALKVGCQFYRQNGTHGKAKEIKIPTWMFPNTRRTVQEDSVDTEIMRPILEFLAVIYHI